MSNQCGQRGVCCFPVLRPQAVGSEVVLAGRKWGWKMEDRTVTCEYWERREGRCLAEGGVEGVGRQKAGSSGQCTVDMCQVPS